MSIKPGDRFGILRDVQTRFNEATDAFPLSLQPEIIHSYTPEDTNSPGLLSLVALPFWIGERLSLDRDVCMDMAVGNLFLLHSFQSFDFIVDNDRPQTSVRSQVVLGNLCYQKVLHYYQPYFSDRSAFWSYMEKYWHEWGESILWEEEPLGQIRPFTDKHLQVAAHKAAALKICPTGMALLSGQPDLIPSFEYAVDWMHATMQLLDDLTDWREDLEHHRFNALLGMLASCGYLSGTLTPFAADITSILQSTDFLDRYSELVVGYAHKGRNETNLLQINAWSMLMDGLAETGPWQVSLEKASIRNQMNTRVVNREGLQTDTHIRGG